MTLSKVIARLEWLRQAMQDGVAGENEMAQVSGMELGQIKRLMLGDYPITASKFRKMSWAFDVDPPADLLDG